MVQHAFPGRLPWWFSGKESSCLFRRCGFNPWVRRSPGEGNGNPLQYSCLGNSMDRRAWRAIVHGIAKNRTRLCEYTTIATSFPISFASHSAKQLHKSTAEPERGGASGLDSGSLDIGEGVWGPLCQSSGKGLTSLSGNWRKPWGKLTVLWEDTNRVLSKVRFWFCLVTPSWSSPGHTQELPASTTMLCLYMNRPASTTRHFVKPLSC